MCLEKTMQEIFDFFQVGVFDKLKGLWSLSLSKGLY